MKAEIEVKFLDIDIEDVRRRLEKAGATLEQPMRLMRRVLIEEPHHAKEDSYIRIRDEGNRATLTFKRRSSPDGKGSINDTEEIETTVGDFDTAVSIFSEAGWHYVSNQESKRETWRLDGAEVVIDQWPWINPYIEIEAETEEIVRRVADALGFDWKNAVFGSANVIFKRDYPNMSVRGIVDIKEGHFGDPVPKEFLG
jgi:adenylate cyclase class 2